MSKPSDVLLAPASGPAGTSVLLTATELFERGEMTKTQSFDLLSGYHGANISRVSSLIGYGARVAGAGSYFDDPDFLSGEAGFGVAMWVKPDFDSTPLAEDTTIFFRGTAGSGDIRLFRYATNRYAYAGQLALQMTVTIGGAPRTFIATFDSKLVNLNWNFLAFSMAFGADAQGVGVTQPRLWLNGSEGVRMSLYGVTQAELDSATAMAGGGGESVFGADLRNTAPSAHYEFADAMCRRGTPFSGGEVLRAGTLPTILFGGVDVTPASFVDYESCYFTTPNGDANVTVTARNLSGWATAIFNSQFIVIPGEGATAFHLWTLTGSEELPLSCAVNVELPIEHLDDSFLYSVQLDDRTYSQGSFVEPSGIYASSAAIIKLVIDTTSDAALLQRFFIENAEFYIATDNLDLFLQGAVTGRTKCRLLSYINEGRDGPLVWKATLSLQRIEK